ncbi:MAG: DUF3343 domain-containing protein [Firmicutes bacterium]|nr:DUF3343 domain-containing protein [Bacillota bacterium]
MATNCYVTFPTIFYAIRAESLLKQKDFTFKMVPVPRSISSSCGTALRCACPDLSKIRQYLADHQTEMEGLYQLEEDGFKMPIVKELQSDELQ